VFIHLNNNSVTTLFVILTVQNTGCLTIRFTFNTSIY